NRWITSISKRPTNVSRLHGGMVGEVHAITLPDGEKLVAKVDPGGKAMLEREGYMLRYLHEHSNLPVPDVIHSDEHLLLMTFVEGNSSFGAPAQEHAAELLADLHSHTAPQFGLERDTLIGPIHQPNDRMNTWMDFFREKRLLYMADVMLGRGALPGDVRKQIDRLAARLDEFIVEPEAPSLVHGDMWTTNVLAQNGRITGFIDPAIYYGHAEIELAYSTLFGTFGEAFFRRYTEIRPLADGFFEVRRDLYNLYPLLVHVRLFGGGYLSSVKRILSKLGV
ncbi:MAG: fructosamine kinase family protein, partial [Chloroflexota bacterium]